LSAAGYVYLTDGFGRLDLPGRLCILDIDPDWVINGTTCHWVWPHDQPANIAGAEIEVDGWFGHGVYVFDVGDLIGPPQIVKKYQKIDFTPHFNFEPSSKREPV
jgi:hypothetical protein